MATGAAGAAGCPAGALLSGAAGAAGAAGALAGAPARWPQASTSTRLRHRAARPPTLRTPALCILTKPLHCLSAERERTTATAAPPQAGGLGMPPRRRVALVIQLADESLRLQVADEVIVAQLRGCQVARRGLLFSALVEHGLDALGRRIGHALEQRLDEI